MLVVIQGTIIQNIRFNTFKNVERGKRLIQLVNFPVLRCYTYFIKSLGVKRRFRMLRDTKILHL